MCKKALFLNSRDNLSILYTHEKPRQASAQVKYFLWRSRCSIEGFPEVFEILIPRSGPGCSAAPEGGSVKDSFLPKDTKALKSVSSLEWLCYLYQRRYCGMKKSSGNYSDVRISKVFLTLELKDEWWYRTSKFLVMYGLKKLVLIFSHVFL